MEIFQCSSCRDGNIHFSWKSFLNTAVGHSSNIYSANTSLLRMAGTFKEGQTIRSQRMGRRKPSFVCYDAFFLVLLWTWVTCIHLSVWGSVQVSCFSECVCGGKQCRVCVRMLNSIWCVGVSSETASSSSGGAWRQEMCSTTYCHLGEQLLCSCYICCSWICLLLNTIQRIQRTLL